jgi:photosystem II stability/assembly factor-like uncharacterized protein
LSEERKQVPSWCTADTGRRSRLTEKDGRGRQVYPPAALLHRYTATGRLSGIGPDLPAAARPLAARHLRPGRTDDILPPRPVEADYAEEAGTMMRAPEVTLTLATCLLLTGCPSTTPRKAKSRPVVSRWTRQAGVRSSPDWTPPGAAAAAPAQKQDPRTPKWYRVPIAEKGSLLGVHFPTAKRGWAVGAQGLVLATRDGGRTWKKQASGLKRAHIYAVHFLDAQRGWACSSYGDGPRARGHVLMGGDMSAAAVLRTTDGGETWKKTWAPTNFTLTGIRMLDEKRGVIVSHGGARHADGDTVTSFDGGKTWRTRRVFRALQALCFVDGKVGYAAGTRVSVGFFPQPRDPLYLKKSSRLVKTTDGGRSWKPLEHPALPGRDQLTGISFADANSGWACGSRGVILHTSDGGKTWKRQKSGVASLIRDVFALSAKQAWAVGREGALLHTLDAGETWKRLPCPRSLHLRRAWFTSPRHGVVVGLKGTVLIYTADGEGLKALADAPAAP